MSERTRTENKVDDGRRHVESRFTAESLVDKGVLAGAQADRDVIRMIPTLNVLKIGGQSVMDRGSTALVPIIEEIQSLVSEHKLLLGAGGGTRSRHVYHVGLRLGLPTGLLAVLGGGPSEQNATMLQALLAQVGGVRIPKDHFEEIPLYLAADCLPIVTGMPPYHYWEPPPAIGHLPANRTDVGVYMISEVFGTRSMIFVKDEDGLHTERSEEGPERRVHPGDLRVGAEGTRSRRSDPRTGVRRHDRSREAHESGTDHQRTRARPHQGGARRRARRHRDLSGRRRLA